MVPAGVRIAVDGRRQEIREWIYAATADYVNLRSRGSTGDQCSSRFFDTFGTQQIVHSLYEVNRRQSACWVGSPVGAQSRGRFTHFETTRVVRLFLPPFSQTIWVSPGRCCDLALLLTPSFALPSHHVLRRGFAGSPREQARLRGPVGH